MKLPCACCQEPRLHNGENTTAKFFITQIGLMLFKMPNKKLSKEVVKPDSVEYVAHVLYHLTTVCADL